MQSHPTPSFADPILADLVERARAAQMVAATAQSAVLAYVHLCLQGTAVPERASWPINADDPGLLTVAQAAARAGRHADTITRWCRERGIGRMYGARWRVSVKRLDSLLTEFSE